MKVGENVDERADEIDEPPTVITPRPGSLAPGRAARRPRRWWRVLRVVLLVIALPLIALAIGLLIAYVVHLIRGNNDPVRTAPLPSASASPSASPSPSASATPQVVVPADWIAEDSPPTGLTFRHPAGWVRRTESPEVLRFAPVSPGSLTPGVEGVGAGFETSTDPAEALRSFAARAYGSQPGFVAAAVEPVTGQNPAEQQEIVTYNRAGVGVRVVLRSFRAQGHTVLVLGRSLSSEPARAAQLESFVEASLAFK